jgi:asparagine synthase (glutamine-hydrolysing)
MVQAVQRMVRTIAHRGPDAERIWTDARGRCVLGHRRLSIIDTSNAGLQPMSGCERRWIICFNGEIYNYLQVRPQLQAAGVQFRGRTDTEVLLEAIAHWGTNALDRIDGQFAFAAFDTFTGELLLARDPFGEKPLYFTHLPDGTVAFASELQALELLPGFDALVDVDAVAEMLTFQYIGAPRSIYRSVQKLPPGHWMKISPSGQTQLRRYFQFRPGLSGFSDQPLSRLADELEDILLRSIGRRMIADVPLGAFLSGGVDSSTVCGLVRRKLSRPLMTFSTGFKDAPESEHLVARQFAKHLGTEHHEEILSPNASEFLNGIGNILDEPNGDSSCLPTYLLSAFARRHVTVAISGDGGDEMFGGYGRYFATLDDLAAHEGGSLPGWTPGSVYYGNRILVGDERHVQDLLGYLPNGFSAHLGRLRRELDEAQRRLIYEMRRTDVDNYLPGAVLPKVDRMSMQHSLEVRTPFLNVELARFAERLPAHLLVDQGRGKVLLRELAYRYLPRELVDLPKQGFGLPMSDWARTELLDVASRLLESEDSHLLAALGRERIANLMDRQRSPGGFSPYQIWAIAVLESWLRHHPAKLPDLHAESVSAPNTIAPPARDESVEHEKFALHGFGLGGTVFLVVRLGSNRNSHPMIDSMSPDIINRAIDCLSEPLDPSEPFASELTIPDWGERLAPDDTARLNALRNATLLFVDRDAARFCDYFECDKFMKLGIKLLVFADPFGPGELIELTLRDMSAWSRMRSFVRLFPQRTVFISNWRLFRALKPVRFAKAQEGYFHSPPLSGVDPVANQELSSTFMVFEGLRQLPPIPTSHHDVAAKGRGRYSIYNRILFFSPTSERHLKRTPYWVVRNNGMNDEFLPISLRREHHGNRPRANIKGVINKPAPRCHLETGDPIVVFTHALPPGGAERQWVYLAQGLRTLGYRVTFVTYDPLTADNSHYVPLLEQSNIPHMDAASFSAVEQIRKWISARLPSERLGIEELPFPEKAKVLGLTIAFLSIKPKVVFAQLDQPNILAGFAGLLADVPRIVLSFRNYNPTNFPYLYNDWYLPGYRFLSSSRRIVFSGNSHDANRDYARWIGIDPERISWIPNAVDPDVFPVPHEGEVEKVRSELAITPDTPVLLGVFRLSPEKAPLTFVETCARTAAEIPDLRILVAGVGPMQGAMEAAFANSGISSRVRFLGRRDDINVLMRLASVLLLTSAKEGMPNVLLEAQLMGTPVVATRTGGTVDTVIDGATAVLCPIGDTAALAGACTRILRNPSLGRKMGTAGRSHVLTTFPKAELANRHLQLLQQGGVDASEDVVAAAAE